MKTEKIDTYGLDYVYHISHLQIATQNRPSRVSLSLSSRPTLAVTCHQWSHPSQSMKVWTMLPPPLKTEDPHFSPMGSRQIRNMILFISVVRHMSSQSPTHSPLYGLLMVCPSRHTHLILANTIMIYLYWLKASGVVASDSLPAMMMKLKMTLLKLSTIA